MNYTSHIVALRNLRKISRRELLAAFAAAPAGMRAAELPVAPVAVARCGSYAEDQAALLRGMGILTVEHVRDMGENALTRLPFPGARQLPKLAGDFLSGRDTADKDRQIAEMQERMAAMEEMLESSQKRGPGRPRKDEAA